jgi:1-acyl-sn-glycerol-3-phosphate acyltransferase
MRLGEIGAGPLIPAAGPRGKRIVRRVRGVALEIVAFIVVTILFPVLFVAALLVDVFLRVTRGKPMVGIRLVPILWFFLFTELWCYSVLLGLWLITGGPFGAGSMRRRRGVYWLRPRWAGSHIGGIKRMFGIRFEIEGKEATLPGRYLIMIRHASIIDNLLPDTQIAGPNGMGIRYVVKRELENLSLLDIGGRWIPTQFLERVSLDPERELATMRKLTEDIGADEAVLIYPEGTRATAKKIARAKEIIREKQPENAHLAESLVNLLPPRLGGPLALLEETEGMDVVFFAHVGFDGYEYVSDIWSGGLIGATIRIKIWRVPAAEIPADERGRTEWLYENWQEMDRWVHENLADLGHTSASGKSAAGTSAASV